jgi:hypothetical protein
MVDFGGFCLCCFGFCAVYSDDLAQSLQLRACLWHNCIETDRQRERQTSSYNVCVWCGEITRVGGGIGGEVHSNYDDKHDMNTHTNRHTDRQTQTVIGNR